MLRILYAGCLGLSLAISAQFTLKMFFAARNHEKFTKPLILGVQGRSRSPRSEWFQVLSRVRQGCSVALDLFLNPMDWILDPTVAQSRLGVSVGEDRIIQRPGPITRTMLPFSQKCWTSWWQDC